MQEYKKVQTVASLKKDQIVNDIFFVKFKKPVEKYQNGYKFELKIGDATGETMMKYWGDNNEASVNSIYHSIKQDDVVFINGKVNEWKEKLEISLNKENTIRILSSGQYNVSDFLKKTKRDIDEMFSELLAIIDSVKDENYKKILREFFNDVGFAKKFRQSPGAMYRHHGWVGGLLEHVLNVVKICEIVAKLNSGLDRDLLVTGAILHDIGKVEELSVTTHIKVTNPGILIGHLAIGLQMLGKVLEKIDVPEEHKLKITHMIVSHHGKLEQGSPKVPAFPEALALYLADELDSSLNMIISIKENAQTEDYFMYTKEFGNVYLR